MITGNECCRCGQHVACPRCEETKEAAAVSEPVTEERGVLRLEKWGDKWAAWPFDPAAPTLTGVGVMGARLEVAPEVIPALCEALGLVSRKLVVSALETCMADVDDAMKGVNRSFTDAITRIMWDDDEPEPAKEVQP